MEPIEQAIFTSAETQRAGGYQVIAVSDGLEDSELREIAAWGPSHGSLLSEGPEAASLNFHRLHSGRYCASRTVHAGPEYSARGGLRVYTHCLIVPPGVLARFANNPFALLRAALANGTLRVHEEIPRRLSACTLSGRAAAVDTALLARLCSSPGAPWLATLLQAALDSVTLAVRGGPAPEALFAGILNCLPPPCRTEFSFSTGLKFSWRRPFRMVALGPDPQEQQRLRRLYHVAVLDLDQPPPAEFTPVEAWPRAVHRILKSGRFSFFANQLARSPCELACEDLSAWGLQLLEEFEATALSPPEHGETPDAAWDGACSPADAARPARRSQPALRLIGRREAAHPEARPDAHAVLPTHSEPSERGAPSQPQTQSIAPGSTAGIAAEPAPAEEAHRHLQRLKSLVRQAIDGNPEALSAFEQLWRQWQRDMPAHQADALRAALLRDTLEVWRRGAAQDGLGSAQHAVPALEIVAILIEPDGA